MTGAAFQLRYMVSIDDRRRHTLQPGYSNSAVSINEHGFRGPMPAADRIVVCLGDSVPFGCGVRDHQTYPAHLCGPVLNAAVPSYNMRQAWDRLTIDVLKHYKPERIAVITIQSANDVSLLTQWRGLWDPDITWADNHPKNEPSWYPPEYMLAHMRQTLTELIDFCRLHHIHLILLPVDPDYRSAEFRPHLDMWAQMYDAQNELLQSLAMGGLVHYFPIQGTQHLDFFHYTARSNKVLGKALGAFIAEKQWL